MAGTLESLQNFIDELNTYSDLESQEYKALTYFVSVAIKERNNQLSRISFLVAACKEQLEANSSLKKQIYEEGQGRS